MTDPVLLDITRLYSRRGLGFDTGIDRVERGYFELFKMHPAHRFVLRGPFGRYLFFRGEKADELLNRKKAHPLADWLFAALRSERKIKLGEYARFLALGHSRHEAHFFQKLKEHNVQIGVMVHDVIPLDYPQFTREDQVERFKSRFKTWCQFADFVITPSKYSAARFNIHAPTNLPNITLPHAIDFVPFCDQTEQKNAFLILGTIEPRKNHVLLFKVWEHLYAKLGESCPELWIIGRRGWNIASEIKFLQNSPLMGHKIFEFGALTDNEVQLKFCEARALLFPSHVEGFGLPLFEAALAKKAFIAAKIPAFVEIMGEDSANLIGTVDIQAWQDAVLSKPITKTLSAYSSWMLHYRDLLEAINKQD